MKKILVLIFLLQTCMLMYAGTDKNESMEIRNVSDLEFNNNPEAVFVNGIFVKSIIGVRLDKYIVNVSKEKCMSPLNINGVTYTYKCNLTSDKVIKLVSLEDIKKIYCPNVKTPCFYMINKNFILNKYLPLAKEIITSKNEILYEKIRHIRLLAHLLMVEKDEKKVSVIKK